MYFWENHNFRSLCYKSRMTLAEARKMARSMARWTKVPVPRLDYRREGKRGDTAWQVANRLTVNLDKAAWTPMLLAHEFAHWVCEYTKVRVQDHGPSWVSVYFQLLDHFKILPLEATVPLARAYGIKFKDPRKC